MSEAEFTGTYYKCEHCNYFWDYEDEDDACPECGGLQIDDVNIKEEYDSVCKQLSELELRKGEIIAMAEMHGDTI